MTVQERLPKKKYQIAVIDDQEAIYLGLRSLLEAEGGHRVEYFDSPEAFLDSSKPQEFDCILLDLIFNGGMDGLQLLDHFARQHLKTPVVMMTSENKANHATTFELGRRAKALLLKPFVGYQLWEAMRKAMEPVLEGANSNEAPTEPPIPARVFQTPATLTKNDYEILKHRAVNRHSLVHRLTLTEMKVFLLLADQCQSNEELAKILFIEESTAITHRTNIHKKLETRNPLKLRDLRDDLL